MLEAIFAIIGGTVLGFFLSECAQSRREDREEKRQAEAVRILISLEINDSPAKRGILAR